MLNVKPTLQSRQLIPYLTLLLMSLIQVFSHDRGGKLSGFLVIIWVFSLLSPQINKITKKEWQWVFLCSLLFLSMLPSYFLSEEEGKAGREMERLVKFLFAPVIIAFLCTRFSLSNKRLLIAVASMAILSFAMGVYDSRPGNPARYLIHGNYICAGFIYASLMVCLIPLLFERKTRWLACLLFLCIGLPLLVTETRGAWLVVMILCPLYAMFRLFTMKDITVKIKLIIIAGLLILSTAVVSTNVFQSRLNDTLSDIELYIESPNTQAGTSIGIRFEIWRAGVGMIKDNPWFGVGLGDIGLHFYKYDEHKQVSKFWTDDNPSPNMHNELINHAVTKGLLSTGVYLLLMLFLLRYFIYSRAHCQLYSDIGLLFVLSILIEGLSYPVLVSHNGIMLFLVFIGVLIKTIEVNKEKLLKVNV